MWQKGRKQKTRSFGCTPKNLKTPQTCTNITKNQSFLTGFSGADTRIRTGDLILTKDALYLLSYISVGNDDMILHFEKKIKRKNEIF